MARQVSGDSSAVYMHTNLLRRSRDNIIHGGSINKMYEVLCPLVYKEDCWERCFCNLPIISSY